MALTLIQAPEILPEGCVEIFLHSDIYTRYFAGTDLHATLERAAKAGQLYLALDDDGRPVGAMKVAIRGFCGLYPYLGLIGVRADSRGLGVGRFLMEQLENLSRRSGARRVTLMVSDFNEGAQRFYRRLGYWQLGAIPNATKEGITELVMVKELV